MSQPYPNPTGYPGAPNGGYPPSYPPAAGFGAPPVGPYPPMVPPVKKSSGGKIAIIIGSVIIFIALVLVLVFNVLLPKLKINDTDSNNFIAALEQHDYTTVYAMMTSHAQSIQSKSALQSSFDPLKLSTSCTTKWTSISTTSNIGSAATKTVGGTLTCPNASSPSFNATLYWIKQSDGTYKLEGATVKP